MWLADAGVDVALVLVVDVDVVVEELDVELVEVDGLQVDVEPVLVDDDVVPEMMLKSSHML